MLIIYSKFNSNCTPTQGFVWKPDGPNRTNGATLPIPLSGGVLSVKPAGLNNLGDVVGTMTVNPWGESAFDAPFLFSKGELYDLNHLSNKPPDSGMPEAINSAGQILFT